MSKDLKEEFNKSRFLRPYGNIKDNIIKCCFHNFILIDGIYSFKMYIVFLENKSRFLRPYGNVENNFSFIYRRFVVNLFRTFLILQFICKIKNCL